MKMKKAMIYYKSRTGITRQLATNIQKHLGEQGVLTGVKSIEEYEESDIEGIDFLFLGCWTGGLMVVFQGPERTWVEFAGRLPRLDGTRTYLFTTYKLLTGSMFKNMQKHLKFSTAIGQLQVIKSRNGNLTEEGRELLNEIAADQES